ncbi:hypothetical protein OH76DRAFT_694914 [Lentinus brumalis]|uniref:Uncharacterized protein n=1 Tax=Lentinus brumalis TaxID=2498619 RepID=A0A371D668_9APHY|nr:hypothetical protein OH76DRAFT_694914 [Polyporus brumalis]
MAIQIAAVFKHFLAVSAAYKRTGGIPDWNIQAKRFTIDDFALASIVHVGGDVFSAEIEHVSRCLSVPHVNCTPSTPCRSRSQDIGQAVGEGRPRAVSELPPFAFPRIGEVEVERWRSASRRNAEGQTGRTPQTSASSLTGAEQVDAAEPVQGTAIEAVTHVPRPPGAVPIGLNHWVLGIVMVLLVGTAVGLEAWYWVTRQKGLPTPWWWITEEFQWRYYLASSSPLGVAMVLSLLWGMIQDAILRLQPLVNLTDDRPGENAKRTILLDYSGNGILASYRALRNSDYAILLLIASTLLTTSMKPLSGAMLSVRDVWWLYPAQNVTGISKVSQDVGDQFKDMIAFQGASGFATAKILFDIGPVPFITEDGHAVEAFQLPVGQNGTAYANVTAVFNRAVCVSPTTFLMENDGTMLWNNTVWFGDCRFSFTVDGDSSNLFGVENLPDLAECTNFTGTPPQHRPVVFWFFSYEPQPIFSAVQCTPQVSVSDVRVPRLQHDKSRGLERDQDVEHRKLELSGIQRALLRQRHAPSLLRCLRRSK